MTGPKFPGTVWGQVNGVVRPVVLSRAASEQAPPAGGSVYYSCKVQQKPEGGAEGAGWCQVRLSAALPHSTLQVSVVQTRCWFRSRCLLGGFGSVGRLNAQQGLDRLQRHALRGLNVHGGSIWPVNDHNPV